MNLPIEQKFLNIINNIIKIYPSFENYSNELHIFILKYKPPANVLLPNRLLRLLYSSGSTVFLL